MWSLVSNLCYRFEALLIYFDVMVFTQQRIKIVLNDPHEVPGNSLQYQEIPKMITIDFTAQDLRIFISIASFMSALLNSLSDEKCRN